MSNESSAGRPSDRAREALAGTRFADLRWVDRTGSTNADLIDAAREGAGECALVADVQDAGRGRLDRSWVAPAGASLLMSVLVRPPFPKVGPHLLSTALGVAAVDAVAELAGLDVVLKWPNDLVARSAGGEDLKLGGMLAELATATTGSPAGSALVLGIGINVAWPDGFPGELARSAISIDLLGAQVDRVDLVVELLRRFDDFGDLSVSAAACERVMHAYRERSATIGRRVRVVLPVGELVGTASDVTLDGALVVAGDDGTDTTVTVGDVVHLRPAGRAG